jgi:hypothetical protein
MHHMVPWPQATQPLVGSLPPLCCPVLTPPSLPAVLFLPHPGPLPPVTPAPPPTGSQAECYYSPNLELANGVATGPLASVSGLMGVRGEWC